MTNGAVTVTRKAKNAHSSERKRVANPNTITRQLQAKAIIEIRKTLKPCGSNGVQRWSGMTGSTLIGLASTIGLTAREAMGPRCEKFHGDKVSLAIGPYAPLRSAMSWTA